MDVESKLYLRGVWVYVVLCHNGKLYTGIANKPDERLKQHKRRRGKAFMQMNEPDRILGAGLFRNRAAAMRVEKHLKRQSAEQKLEWARQYPWETASANAAD